MNPYNHCAKTNVVHTMCFNCRGLPRFHVGVGHSQTLSFCIDIVTVVVIVCKQAVTHGVLVKMFLGVWKHHLGGVSMIPGQLH